MPASSIVVQCTTSARLHLEAGASCQSGELSLPLALDRDDIGCWLVTQQPFDVRGPAVEAGSHFRDRVGAVVARRDVHRRRMVAPSLVAVGVARYLGRV
jgi:hypothetical protein